ncbi:hypothetical protein [uncultured Legionella sp.]|uniref:hypothetical protein n=1 Tax=uncultured Legionella sp. TaxID=210934 RepID=UPI0026200476|nr:hypothetical protein [uncultured Legionella sp.]
MYELFNRIQIRVSEILIFGPCNSKAAQNASNVYYANQQKQQHFRLSPYTADECKALPAVIANTLCPRAENKQKLLSAQEHFEQFFTNGYVYGTGTCEVFSIIGAYILATEFDFELSIETIYSHQSHTYIRLHTEPECIFDFWAIMMCRYNDTVSWNEFFGEQFIRNTEAVYKTDLILTSQQLIEMGQRVIIPHNKALRTIIHTSVLERVENVLKQVDNLVEQEPLADDTILVFQG